jgi:hypothetical protein
VTCFTIVANQAWLGGYATSGLFTEPPNNGAIWRVVDNGQGATALADQISLQFVAPPPADVANYCATTPERPVPAGRFAFLPIAIGPFGFPRGLRFPRFLQRPPVWSEFGEREVSVKRRGTRYGQGHSMSSTRTPTMRSKSSSPRSLSESDGTSVDSILCGHRCAAATVADLCTKLHVTSFADPLPLASAIPLLDRRRPDAR